MAADHFLFGTRALPYLHCSAEVLLGDVPEVGGVAIKEDVFSKLEFLGLFRDALFSGLLRFQTDFSWFGLL